MAQASRDDNFVTTLLAVSSVDGVTPVTLYANPTTHRLLVDSAGGYTNLTQFVDQTPWRLFYSNGSGDVTELALGGAGTYLQSNGAALAPTWVTPGGAGDVVGPASATDNAIARFDLTTGKLIQNSVKTLSDSGDNETLNSTSLNPTFNIVAPSDATHTYSINITGISTANIDYRLFRTTNTSGNPGFVIHKGDGTITTNHKLSGRGNSYLALDNGNVGIGLSTGASKLHVRDSTDASSVQALILEGDRATPAANDTVYQSFLLSDSVGNQDEFVRISARAEDVTSTSEDGRLIFSTAVAGVLTDRLLLSSASLRPSANDGLPLGEAGAQFSDLFLAEGGVINWDNGDVTLTQTGDTLNVAGGSLIVDTQTGTLPFYVTRLGSITEALSIKVDDGNVIFESIQDENSGTDGGFQFLLDDGGTASPNLVVRTASSTNALFTVNKAGISAFKNFTDAASNQVLVIEGDRATPAANDEVYMSFKLSDSAGNQDEFARITVRADDVTSTSEDASILFTPVTAGSLATAGMVLTGATLRPGSNDGKTLGISTHQWSDLFLAEGGVINWDNGDVTMTQTGDVLAISGGDLRVATAGVGTNADSVPTISSTNTLTNKRITPRTGTTTSSATPTINTDNVDFYSLTAQAVDITSFTTNLSGTPTDGQKLWIAITGTAARAITWGASFEASTVALPTTTVTTNRLDVGFVWNAATSKWRCIASA